MSQLDESQFVDDNEIRSDPEAIPCQSVQEATKEARNKIVDFSVIDVGLAENHPVNDPAQWPRPEGTSQRCVDYQQLRKPFVKVFESDQIETDLELLINSVGIHTCVKVWD